jgi:hypothetical protein
MKKILALAVLVAIVWIAYNRERLFLRDPLGHVTRNGVEEKGAQVFINYDNDVLLENDNPPMYLSLIQAGQAHVGAPKDPGCIHFAVCLLDAHPATLASVGAETKIGTMTNKEARFTDSEGRDVVVTLR